MRLARSPHIAIKIAFAIVNPLELFDVGSDHLLGVVGGLDDPSPRTCLDGFFERSRLYARVALEFDRLDPHPRSLVDDITQIPLLQLRRVYYYRSMRIPLLSIQIAYDSSSGLCQNRVKIVPDLETHLVFKLLVLVRVVAYEINRSNDVAAGAGGGGSFHLRGFSSPA